MYIITVKWKHNFVKSEKKFIHLLFFGHQWSPAVSKWCVCDESWAAMIALSLEDQEQASEPLEYSVEWCQ